MRSGGGGRKRADGHDGTDCCSDGAIRASDSDHTLRERTDVNGYWFWLLFGADRWAVAGGLAVAVFLAFMLLGVLKPVSLHSAMQASNMVEKVFAGLIGAIITGTSLVVTINQLVLSQEIGSLDTQHTRMDSVLDHRQHTDALLGRATPADPATYLDALVGATERRATRLEEVLSGAQAPLHEAVDEYVDDLVEHADSVRKHLVDADFGTFDVVYSALDYNYDRKMHDIRRLGVRYDDDLTSEERAAFRDLHEALATYGVVREHLKDLYSSGRS